MQTIQSKFCTTLYGDSDVGDDLWMLLTEFRCWRPKLSPTHLVSNNRHQYHPLYKSNWPDKLSWKQQLLQLYYRNAHLVIQGNQHSMFSIQNNRLMCTFHDKGLSFVSLTTQVCPSLSSNLCPRNPAVKLWNQSWKSARILANIFVFKYEADIDCLWALMIHFLKRLNFTSCNYGSMVRWLKKWSKETFLTWSHMHEKSTIIKTEMAQKSEPSQ